MIAARSFAIVRLIIALKYLSREIILTSDRSCRKRRWQFTEHVIVGADGRVLVDVGREQDEGARGIITWITGDRIRDANLH